MINKKRYITPYVEFIEEDMDTLLDIGIKIGSGGKEEEDDENSRQAKESSFFDSGDDSDFVWDTDFSE